MERINLLLEAKKAIGLDLVRALRGVI